MWVCACLYIASKRKHMAVSMLVGSLSSDGAEYFMFPPGYCFCNSVSKGIKEREEDKRGQFHRNEYNHGKKPVKARVLPEVKLNSHHQSVMSKYIYSSTCFFKSHI